MSAILPHRAEKNGYILWFRLKMPAMPGSAALASPSSKTGQVHASLPSLLPAYLMPGALRKWVPQTCSALAYAFLMPDALSNHQL